MDALSQEITQGKTAKIWKNSLLYAMAPVKAAAISLAPGGGKRSTGQLRDSIYLTAHKPKARDKKAQSYMGEIYMARVSIKAAREESVSNTTLKNGKFRTTVEFKNSNKPVGLAMEFGTAKVAAKPFMRPALESNIQNIQDRLAKYLWAELSMGKYGKDVGFQPTVE